MLAHLCYERRLLDLAANPSLPDIGGKAYFVTDPNPPVRFRDVYLLLETLSVTKTKFNLIAPILLSPISHFVEWYDILTYYISALPKLQFPLTFMQPALFGVSSVHTIIDDSHAKAKPEDGGLGYNAPVDTMSGLCFQVSEWNRNVEAEKGKVNGKIDLQENEGLEEILQKATAPVLRKA